MKDKDQLLWKKFRDVKLRARSVLSSGSKGPVSDTVAEQIILYLLSFLNRLKISEANSVPVN